MALMFVTTNRSGGNCTIRIPDDVVRKFDLIPGSIARPKYVAKRLGNDGHYDLAKFLNNADWPVQIRTDEQHSDDVIARYT